MEEPKKEFMELLEIIKAWAKNNGEAVYLFSRPLGDGSPGSWATISTERAPGFPNDICSMILDSPVFSASLACEIRRRGILNALKEAEPSANKPH